MTLHQRVKKGKEEVFLGICSADRRVRNKISLTQRVKKGERDTFIKFYLEKSKKKFFYNSPNMEVECDNRLCLFFAIYKYQKIKYYGKIKFKKKINKEDFTGCKTIDSLFFFLYITN